MVGPVGPGGTSKKLIVVNFFEIGNHFKFFWQLSAFYWSQLVPLVPTIILEK